MTAAKTFFKPEKQHLQPGKSQLEKRGATDGGIIKLNPYIALKNHNTLMP